MERYQVEKQINRDEYLRDLEHRMEKEWNDREDLDPTMNAKNKPTSFPGADGWYT